LAIADWINLV